MCRTPSASPSSTPPCRGRWADLPRLLVAAGVGQVETTAHTVLSRPGFFQLLLDRRIRALCDATVITAAQAGAWWSAIEAAADAGHFTGGATVFVVSGTAR